MSDSRLVLLVETSQTSGGGGVEIQAFLKTGCIRKVYSWKNSATVKQRASIVLTDVNDPKAVQFHPEHLAIFLKNIIFFLV